jgi:hypothetical protein
MGFNMRTAIPLALLATAFACSLFAAPAQAQRDRVFVASYGSDSNPCTFGSPCKTFQNAVSVVAAGGEVTAIDSAGFGPVDITKAVTITSPNGVEAGIAAPAAGTAVTVAAGASDVVVLSGLTLEGSGSAAYGINFTSGAELEVINCAVRNYTSVGISVATSAATTVLIYNSTVSDIPADSGTGILLATDAGGSIIAAFDGVTVNHTVFGIYIQSFGGPTEVSVANSHIDNNLNAAFDVNGTSNSDTSSLILNDDTMNQTPNGVVLTEYATVWLSHVTQAAVSGFTPNAAINFTSATGTKAYSDGTNHLMSAVTGGTTTAWPQN